MARQEKKSFILYHSYDKQIRLLSREERGDLLTAIFDYEITGKQPRELSLGAEILFSVISTALDRDREAYEEMCRRQSERGRKGGRPPKVTQKEEVWIPSSDSNEKSRGFFGFSEKADNGNDKDNEKDNDNDNGKEEEKKKEKESAAFSPCVPQERVPASVEPIPFPTTPTTEAPPVGPRLTREEKERLLATGLPRAYLEKRESRAVLYGEKQGRSGEEILLDWWREDRKEKRWISAPQKRDTSETGGKSYDVEDFWQAALEKSYSTLK